MTTTSAQALALSSNILTLIADIRDGSVSAQNVTDLAAYRGVVTSYTSDGGSSAVLAALGRLNTSMAKLAPLVVATTPPPSGSTPTADNASVSVDSNLYSVDAA